MDCIEKIFELFNQRGAAEYFGEPVSQLEHALQAAYFASIDNADEILVIAALLHDVGHLLTGREDMAEAGVDGRHQESGYAWLSKYFASTIAEPVRLHVDAKRYLCSSDDTYLRRLSPASILSLQLQGGPFSRIDALDFVSQRHAAAAIRLRIWDDMAKVPGLHVPGLEFYGNMLYRHTM